MAAPHALPQHLPSTGQTGPPCRSPHMNPAGPGLPTLPPEGKLRRGQLCHGPHSKLKWELGFQLRPLNSIAQDSSPNPRDGDRAKAIHSPSSAFQQLWEPKLRVCPGLPGQIHCLETECRRLLLPSGLCRPNLTPEEVPKLRERESGLADTQQKETLAGVTPKLPQAPPCFSSLEGCSLPSSTRGGSRHGWQHRAPPLPAGTGKTAGALTSKGMLLNFTRPLLPT